MNATAGARDRLLIHGLRYFGHHGVHPEERALGSHFTIDVEVTADLSGAAESDRLGDTINYSLVAELARREVEGEPRQLLEALAGRIAAAVLALPGARQVVIRVTKEPRLPAQTSGFAVEIRRP